MSSIKKRLTRVLSVGVLIAGTTIIAPAAQAVTFSQACTNAGGVNNAIGGVPTCDFSYSGGSKTWTAPSSGNYKLETWGASGSKRSSSYGEPGLGGYSKGELFIGNNVTNLSIYVGEQGDAVSSIQSFNGGGKGGYGNGGGGTDIRLDGSLYSRIIVAGGGGGAGVSSGYTAGHGGGTNGLNAELGPWPYAGQGGEQTKSNYYGGIFGIGGDELHWASGGGAGGWFGGGSTGGGNTNPPPPGMSGSNGGGGGGSGYVLTSTSYKPSGYTPTSAYWMTNTQLIAGNQSMPAPNGGTQTGQNGHGFARITQLVSPPTISNSTAVIQNDVNPLNLVNNTESVRYGWTINNTDTSNSFTSLSHSITNVPTHVTCGALQNAPSSMSPGQTINVYTDCTIAKDFFLGANNIEVFDGPSLTTTGSFNGGSVTLNGVQTQLTKQNIVTSAAVSETMTMGTPDNTPTGTIDLGDQVIITTTVNNTGTTTLNINQNDFDYLVTDGTNRVLSPGTASIAPGSSQVFTLSFNADVTQASSTPLNNTTDVKATPSDCATLPCALVNVGTASSSNAVTPVTPQISLTQTPTSTNGWSYVAPAPMPHTYATYSGSLPIIDGKAHIFGGYNGASFANTHSVYDIANNSWSTSTPLPFNGYAMSYAVIGRDVYVIGGYNTISNVRLNSVYKYNVDTNTWATAANLPVALSHLTAEVINNEIYVIGGYDGSATNSVYRYSPLNNSWSTMANIPYNAYLSSTSVHNGKIYLTGGVGTTSLSNASVYDPVANSWSTLSNMPSALYSHTSEIINGKLFIAGGHDGSYTSAVRSYNFTTNTWSTETNMSTARYGASSFVYNNEYYIVGGYTGSSFLNTVEKLSSTQSEWINPDTLDVNKVNPGDTYHTNLTMTNTSSSTITLDTLNIIANEAGWVINQDNASITTLAPGASTTFTASWTAPNNVLTETHNTSFTANGNVVGCSTCSAVASAPLGVSFDTIMTVASIDLTLTSSHSTPIPGGTLVTFTYLVENQSSLAVENVNVTTSDGLTVTCPSTTINANASMTCTATKTL